jgi:hypothetical protein
LAVDKRTTNQLKLERSDRLLWVRLSRMGPAWGQGLVIVAAATVLRWQRPLSPALGQALPGPRRCRSPRQYDAVALEHRLVADTLAKAGLVAFHFHDLWHCGELHGHAWSELGGREGDPRARRPEHDEAVRARKPASNLRTAVGRLDGLFQRHGAATIRGGSRLGPQW